MLKNGDFFNAPSGPQGHPSGTMSLAMRLAASTASPRLASSPAPIRAKRLPRPYCRRNTRNWKLSAGRVGARTVKRKSTTSVVSPPSGSERQPGKAGNPGAGSSQVAMPAVFSALNRNPAPAARSAGRRRSRCRRSPGRMRVQTGCRTDCPTCHPVGQDRRR